MKVLFISPNAERLFMPFYFTDNTFNFPAPYALELCHRLPRARLDQVWRCTCTRTWSPRSWWRP